MRGPARPGRRSRAEAARTRQRILDRAERLFARKGYRAVSTRELARACGVQPYTIQHHFGSKLKLYEAVLCRWDDEIRALSASHVDGAPVGSTTSAAVDELLDYLLARSDWVALNLRRSLGEGLPARIKTADPGWVRFIDSALRRTVGARRDLDSRLLLLTIEGILHHHVVSRRRYRELLGRDLDDPRLRRAVKRHLSAVIAAIVRATGATPARRPA
ncbi:MAG: helix-turn-helix domain-containing protein [Thermodesulfobacteriota bacterium]